MSNSLIYSCILAICLSGPATAQSFSCHKATTPTEHAICDGRELANLDVAMAAAQIGHA